jgi:hypothetical protein
MSEAPTPARRKCHKPRPRPGVELRRYDILIGHWGTEVRPTMRHHYPMMALLGCVGCGRTIRCLSPDHPWEHVKWESERDDDHGQQGHAECSDAGASALSDGRTVPVDRDG